MPVPQVSWDSTHGCLAPTQTHSSLFHGLCLELERAPPPRHTAVSRGLSHCLLSRSEGQTQTALEGAGACVAGW